jgi:hypothetical protein
MGNSLMKRELKVPTWLWIALAVPGVGVAGIALISLALSLKFALDPLNAPTDTLVERLADMPRGKEAAYIKAVLSDDGNHKISPMGRSNLLLALEYAQRHGVPLAYDMALIFPYAGNYFTEKYDEPVYEEPARITADKILMHSGRADVVNRAFEVYGSNKELAAGLCQRDQDEQKPDKVYLDAQARYCKDVSNAR